MFRVEGNLRVLYFFRGSSELRLERRVPRRGGRFRSSRGKDWIVDDVVQSGAATYTATCVAPHEIDDAWDRAAAYLRRDREFVIGALLFAPIGVGALSTMMAVWISVAVVAAVETFLLFVWATQYPIPE